MLGRLGGGERNQLAPLVLNPCPRVPDRLDPAGVSPDQDDGHLVAAHPSDEVVVAEDLRDALRDGAQREGLVLSLQDKLRLARALDEFGMPAIEGGWPGSNPCARLQTGSAKHKPLRSETRWVASTLAFRSFH